MAQSKRRILCADTHRDTCELLTLLLEMQGHEVVSVHTVNDCLQQVRELKFDLYMLDDSYPDGNSYDLCQRLRELTPETPILFFSSAAFARDREKAMRAGARAYLSKPGDILEVAQTVNAILLGSPH